MVIDPVGVTVVRALPLYINAGSQLTHIVESEVVATPWARPVLPHANFTLSPLQMLNVKLELSNVRPTGMDLM